MLGILERLRRIFSGKPEGVRKDLSDLESKIGYSFKSRRWLVEALTHRSVLGEKPPGAKVATYERLEFLGDSVLALIINDHLIRSFPDEDEGQLTKKKSLLVSRSVLAKKAEQIDIKDHVILSKNAFKGNVALQESIQTAVIEALIGAIYLDGGIGSARRFIESRILNDMDEILGHKDNVNYKSLLQEYAQSDFGSYPEYKVRSTTGPEHDKIFVVEVKVKGEIAGMGRGRSKKDAEQIAAKEALSKLKGEA